MVKLPSKLVEYLKEVVRSLNRVLDMETTPFAVHYEKMRIHLREKANNCESNCKRRLFARESDSITIFAF